MADHWWTECTDPMRMLRHIHGKVSDRRLRLYACGCCRRIWRWLGDERSRRAVEAAEGLADGSVAAGDLAAAQASAQQAVLDLHAYQTALRYCYEAARSSLYPGAWEAACECTTDLQLAAQGGLAGNYPASQSNPARTEREQCRILRDIIGHHVRPVVVAATWLTPRVSGLARMIYHEQTFERMPQLAEALE
jgi:hypothetical protein